MTARKSALLLCALAVLFSVLSGCATPDVRRSVTFTDLFDTVTEFTAYGLSEKSFDEVSDAVYRELLRYHRLCDIYHSYEDVVNLYTLNNRGDAGSFPLDGDLYAVLALGKKYYDLSGGKLNIAMGSVLSLWRDCFSEGDRIPDGEELSASAQHIGFDSVTLDDGSHAVAFSDGDVRFDAGAVAKGAAGDSVSRMLRERGVRDFVLNIGGNVIASGKKPDGNWIIGIQDPAGGIYTKLSLTDISAVTSGDYQRFFELDGTVYHHIIDPDTCFPASLYRSVTVLCESSSDADALSTALFCMDREAGAALAAACGAEVLWIYADGHAVRTEGFAKYEQ